MNVLLIAPSLDTLGGQSIQASRIRKEMESVPDVTMRFLPIDLALPGPIRWLKRIPLVRTAINFVHYFLLLLAGAARADVLHVFSASYWSYNLWTLPAILVGRAFGKTVIVNYRDGRCADHMQNWPLALPTVRLAHAVVAPSGFLVDVFVRVRHRRTRDPKSHRRQGVPMARPGAAQAGVPDQPNSRARSITSRASCAPFGESKTAIRRPR